MNMKMILLQIIDSRRDILTKVLLRRGAEIIFL